jgi:hypothetical protein
MTPRRIQLRTKGWRKPPDAPASPTRPAGATPTAGRRHRHAIGRHVNRDTAMLGRCEVDRS